MTTDRRSLPLASLVISAACLWAQPACAFNVGRGRELSVSVSSLHVATHLVPNDDDDNGTSTSTASPFSGASDRRSAVATMLGTGVAAALIVAPRASFASESDGRPTNDNQELAIARPMGVVRDGDDDSSSSTSRRPSAPLEYLLPASRVGAYIYQALAVAEHLAAVQSNGTADSDTALMVDDDVAKLDALLLSSPPTFIKPSDPTVSRGDAYNNAPPILGEIGAVAQKQRERRERSIDVGLAPSFFELGELVGERRSWNQLQSAEMKREAASEVRRAFNIYTTNLNFNPNKYEWKGSREEKSKRIRDDRLPSTTDVIRSDLDARDLYRNEVQQKLEDARAEFIYQKKQYNSSGTSGRSSGSNGQNGVSASFDTTELVGLLRDAQVAVDRWFSFIAEDDVREALDAVKQEQQQRRQQ